MEQNKTYQYVSWIATAATCVSGIYAVYCLLTSGDWDFNVNWNMFSSILMTPLFVVGFIIAMLNWLRGDSHYSQETHISTDGGKTWSKSNDVTDAMFDGCILPLLMHFILEPLMWAAIIYYPLMGIYYVIGRIMPYILSVVVVLAVIAFGFVIINLQHRFRYYIAIVLSLILCVIFVIGGQWIAPNDSAGSIPQGVVLDGEEVLAEPNPTEPTPNPTPTPTPIPDPEPTNENQAYIICTNHSVGKIELKSSTDQLPAELNNLYDILIPEVEDNEMEGYTAYHNYGQLDGVRTVDFIADEKGEIYSMNLFAGAKVRLQTSQGLWNPWTLSPASLLEKGGQGVETWPFLEGCIHAEGFYFKFDREQLSKEGLRKANSGEILSGRGDFKDSAKPTSIVIL